MEWNPNFDQIRKGLEPNSKIYGIRTRKQKYSSEPIQLQEQ